MDVKYNLPKIDNKDVLRKTAQTLTSSEKAQVLENIGAAKKDNIFSINGSEVSEGDEVIVGEGGVIVIDDEMSGSSTNAVQNKVVKAYVDAAYKAMQDQIGNAPTYYIDLPYAISAGYINEADGTEASSTTNHKTDYIDVSAFRKIKFLGIKTKSSLYSGYAFYDSNKDCLSGFSHRWEIDSSLAEHEQHEYVVDVPVGAKYFRTTLRDAQVTESDFYMKGQENLAHIIEGLTPDDSLSETSTNPLQNKVVDSELKKLYEEVLSNPDYTKTVVDIENVGLRDYSIIDTGKYGANATYKHFAKYVQPNDIVVIKAGEYPARYCFVANANKSTSGGNIPLVEGESVVYVPAGIERIVRVPQGAVAILVFANSNIPQKLEIYSQNNEDLTLFRSNGFEVTAEGSVAVSANYNSYICRVKANNTYIFEISINSGNAFYGVLSDLPYVQQVANSHNNFNYIYPNAKIKVNPTEDGFFIVSCVGQIVSVDVTKQTLASNIESSRSVEEIADDVANIINETYNFDEVDLTALAKRSYQIHYPENAYGGSIAYKHVIYPVSAGQYVKIKKNASGNRAQVAWLTDNDTPDAYGVPPFVEGTVMSYYGNVTLKVPQGANYIYMYAGASPYSYLPSYFAISNANQQGSNEEYEAKSAYLRGEITARALSNPLMPTEAPQVDENGWEIIKTIQQLNAVKKADQLCKIEFTPKANIPMKPHDGSPLTSEAWFEPNVKVTGLPYSSNNEIGEFGIDTFATAANNKYSLLYSERVYYGSQHSDWGKQYLMSTNGFAYYGSVCCGLTSTCIGFPIKLNNPAHDEADRINGLFVSVYPQSADFLKVGDILDSDTHSFMIYGIHRTDGVIDKFKIAEESTSWTGDPIAGGVRGGAVIREVTKSTIEGQLGQFRAYRYVKMFENLDYKQSDYVAATGESEVSPTFNNDICTFAGDKAVFMQGDLVVLNYNLSDDADFAYDRINLYKDGSDTPTVYMLSDIDQTELPDGTGNYWTDQRYHALKLTGIASGKYEARMSDGTDESEGTMFEVLSNAVTIQKLGEDKFKIAYNGDIQAVYVGRYGTTEAVPVNHFVGSTACLALPSYWEHEKGEMVIYPKKLANDAGVPTYGSHIKVVVKCEYGTAKTPVYDLSTGEIVVDE